MRPLARAAVLAATTLVVGAFPVLPLLAAPGSSITTPPSRDAWYRSSRTCTLPTGCASAPTSYPAHTLHVGVTLGTEDSRSYLQLDLTKLPPGTKPTGGQLRLPLAPASDGTASPETAKLRACLALQPVQPADGEVTAQPPDTACDLASVDAVFVPAAGAVPPAFTVDLAALAAGWQSGAGAPGAIALLPADALAPTDSWHLTFSALDRTGAGVVKPVAVVSYTGGTVDAAGAPPKVEAPVQAAPAAAPVAAVPGAVDAPTAADAPAVAPPATGPGPVVATTQQPVGLGRTAVQPVASVGASVRYPGVFLLPLVLLAGVGWLGRALTRDLRAS